MPVSQPEGFLSTLRQIICRLLGCDPQPPPPPPPAKEPRRSFEPGQVAILAEYPPGIELTPRQIVDRVATRLDQINIDGREKVLLAPERVIILRGPQLTLATVLGDVPAARQDPARLIRFVDRLHQVIKKPPLETRPSARDTIKSRRASRRRKAANCSSPARRPAARPPILARPSSRRRAQPRPRPARWRPTRMGSICARRRRIG